MDFRQLAALAAIADHGSFSAAAKALFTVQSNVSAHVARLERELGVTLVDRSRGCLTEEGEVVVARARAVQNELDAIYADLASRGKEVAGDARLGVIGTTARWLVPRSSPPCGSPIRGCGPSWWSRPPPPCSPSSPPARSTRPW